MARQAQGECNGGAEIKAGLNPARVRVEVVGRLMPPGSCPNLRVCSQYFKASPTRSGTLGGQLPAGSTVSPYAWPLGAPRIAEGTSSEYRGSLAPYRPKRY